MSNPLLYWNKCFQERLDTTVKSIDEMLLGTMHKIFCFIFKKCFDLGKEMPILKRKLDLSNFLALRKSRT